MSYSDDIVQLLQEVINEDDDYGVIEVIDIYIRLLKEKKQEIFSKLVIDLLKRNNSLNNTYINAINKITLTKENLEYDSSQVEINIEVHMKNDVVISKCYMGSEKYMYEQNGFEDIENNYKVCLKSQKILIKNQVIFDIDTNDYVFYTKENINNFDENKFNVDINKIKLISQMFNENNVFQFLKNIILMIYEIYCNKKIHAIFDTQF